MTTHIDPSMTPDDASPETIARNMVNHTKHVTFQQSHEVARAYLQLRDDLIEFLDEQFAYASDPDPEHDYERADNARFFAYELCQMLEIPLPQYK